MKEKKRGKAGGRVILVVLIAGIILGGGVFVGYRYLEKLYDGFRDKDAPAIVSGEASFTPRDEPSSGFSTDEPGSESPTDGESGASEAGGDPSGAAEGSDSIYKKAQRDENVLNILLLGIDVEDFNRQNGRSDSMILLSYNRKTAKVTLYSIHRDCLAELPQAGWNKLNTAYYFGGVGQAVNSVNDLFGLDIQQYATVDWSGLRELIDYMGGVTVKLTQAEIDYYGWDKTPGENLLTGAEVHRHVSNRTLAKDDWERSRRQRDVLTAIYGKVKSYSAAELADFIRYASGVVKTNIPFETAVSYGGMLLLDADRIEIKSASLPYAGSYTEGWYQKGTLKLAVVKVDYAANRKKLMTELYGGGADE